MKSTPILAMLVLTAFGAGCASGAKTPATASATAPTPVPTPPGDKSAPIAVSTDVIVELSPAEVWAVLSDVDNWGVWNPKVTEVKHGAGLNIGSELSYRWEEHKVEAVVEQLKENELFVWRGSRSGDNVLMQWTLRPSGAANALVSLRSVLTPKASQTFQANAGLENQAWVSSLQAELAKRLAAKPKPVKKAKAPKKAAAKP